ncbi:hypothetical protein C0J52_20630, partial [Blattella germanica]
MMDPKEITSTFNKFYTGIAENILNNKFKVAISFHHAQNKQFACLTMKIDNNEIKYKDQSKFLGMWLDDTLKWFTHIQELSKRLKMHAYNTRNKENFSVTRCNTSLCTNNLNHMRTRMYNFLPHNLKEISALSIFKKALFRFSIDNCIYIYT